MSVNTAMAMSEVRTPNHNDVLCGRGGGTNSHPANVLFRNLVTNKKKIYLMSRFKREKRVIAKEIVTRIRNQNPPGRFLLRNDHTGRYNDIGDASACKKASQALREGAPNIRKEIYEEVLKKKKKSDLDRSDDYDENDDEIDIEPERPTSPNNYTPNSLSSAESSMLAGSSNTDCYFGSQFGGFAAQAASYFQGDYCGTYWQGSEGTPQHYQASSPQQHHASSQQYRAYCPPHCAYVTQNPPAYYSSHQVSPYASDDGSNFLRNRQYPATNSIMSRKDNPLEEASGDSNTSGYNHAQVKTNEPSQLVNVHNISNESKKHSRHDTPICHKTHQEYRPSNNPFVTPSNIQQDVVTLSLPILTSNHDTHATAGGNFDSQLKLKRDDSDEKVLSITNSKNFSDNCNFIDMFQNNGSGRDSDGLCGMKLSFMVSEENDNQNDMELSLLHDATVGSISPDPVESRFGGLQRHSSNSSKSSCRSYS